ncbi:MAG: hypothetical protein SGCHY_004924, partial [Lobulomycetales sp.]
MLLSYEAPNYFFDKPGGGKVLRVDVDQCYSSGACNTTENSDHPRTEFREATDGWSLQGPTRTMTVEFSVDENANTKGVVVAQIHGPGPLPNVLLMMTPSGDLIVEDKQNQRGVPIDAGNLITNYQLGTRVRLDILAGNSRVAFKINGAESGIVLNSPYDGQYFKAGTYCIQSSSDLASNAVFKPEIQLVPNFNVTQVVRLSSVNSNAEEGVSGWTPANPYSVLLNEPYSNFTVFGLTASIQEFDIGEFLFRGALTDQAPRFESSSVLPVVSSFYQTLSIPEEAFGSSDDGIMTYNFRVLFAQTATLSGGALEPDFISVVLTFYDESMELIPVEEEISFDSQYSSGRTTVASVRIIPPEE